MENHIVQYLQSTLNKPVEGPSPAGNWLKGIVTDASEGDITVDYIVRPEMCNPVGTVHGGMLALMIDEVIGIATFSLQTEFLYTTVNLSLDYLSNSRTGETVTTRATVIRKGKNIINIAAKITDKSGKILVKASSNLAKTTNKLFN